MQSLKLFLSIIVTLGSLSCGSFGDGISQSPDPEIAVKSAFEKFVAAKAFRLEIKTNIGEGIGETEVDYLAPDRFRIKNLSNATSEIIAIGSDSYNRLAEAKWTKIPPGKAFNTAEFRERLFEQARSALSDVKALGSEEFNGTKSFTYSFKSGSNPDYEYKIWISAESGLPLQMIGEKKAEPAGTVTTTYDFNDEIIINAPPSD
ncbi:MAG: hypothetical protein KDB79_03625 [Acidobacteria bacterium]|nr:hypothetical protein [Acidobacteriota bacterium]